LHDEAGQMLASLLAGLRRIEGAKSFRTTKTQVRKLRKLTTRTIEEVGRLAQDLHPLVLDDLGLAVALQQYAEEYSRLHGIRVRLKITGLGSSRLAGDLELGLYRIAQEALTNVAKHARAKTVSMSIQVKARQLTMTIVDNGQGFKPLAAKMDSKNHLGCHGMRERASMLGGQLNIDSRVGTGTSLIVKIPATLNQRKQPQPSSK
jgi:signal transduction histidine kinase